MEKKYKRIKINKKENEREREREEKLCTLKTNFCKDKFLGVFSGIFMEYKIVGIIERRKNRRSNTSLGNKRQIKASF